MFLLDGVRLTGVEFSTMSGSKDKLLNTCAEVTYVFNWLPDCVSPPVCSLSPQVCLGFFFSPLFFNVFLFFPSVWVSTMNFCTQRTVTWHRAIELASVKRTKLHSHGETDLILADSPGAYTLNRARDYFNLACLLCVRDNDPLVIFWDNICRKELQFCSVLLQKSWGFKTILMLIPHYHTEHAQQWALCDLTAGIVL